jgi:RimJ/RimL family protein N-acetyltransferase
VFYRKGSQAAGLDMDRGTIWALAERLGLGADTRNAASLRVAAKSGFRREGTLHGLVRRGEERSDDAICSLLPTDWRGATEPD